LDTQWASSTTKATILSDHRSFECFPPPGTDDGFGSTEKVTVFTKIIQDTTSRGNNGCIDPRFLKLATWSSINEMRGDTTKVKEGISGQ